MQQPEWVHDEGVIAALNRHLCGKDWVALTSTCAALRPYSHLCKHLSALVYCDRGEQVPPYATHLSLVNPSADTAIPDTVVSLDITYYCPTHIYPVLCNPRQLPPIPKTLRHVRILFNMACSGFNHVDYSTLPAWVTSLELVLWEPCKSFPTRLPATVKELKLTNCDLTWLFYTTSGLIPPTLETLRLHGPCRDVDKPNILEVFMGSNIRHLELGGEFDADLFFILFPLSLRVLELGDAYDRSLSLVAFNQGLEVLSVGTGFTYALNLCVFPDTMKEIRLKRPISKEKLPTKYANIQVIVSDQVNTHHSSYTCGCLLLTPPLGPLFRTEPAQPALKKRRIQEKKRAPRTHRNQPRRTRLLY